MAITPVNHPGGAETTLLRLLSRLAARGWEVTLTTPGPGPAARPGARAGYGWRALALGGLRPALRRARDRLLAGRATAGPAGRRRVSEWRRVRAAAAGAPAGPYACSTSTTSSPSPAVLAPGRRRARRLPGRRRPACAGSTRPGCLRAGRADPPPAAAPWPTGNGPVIGFIGRIEPRKGPLDLVRAAPRSGAAPRAPEARAGRRATRTAGPGLHRARLSPRRMSSISRGSRMPRG